MPTHLTDWNVSKQSLAESVKVSTYTAPMTFRKESCFIGCQGYHKTYEICVGAQLFLQLPYLLLACLSLMRLRNKVFRIPPPQDR